MKVLDPTLRSEESLHADELAQAHALLKRFNTAHQLHKLAGEMAEAIVAIHHFEEERPNAIDNMMLELVQVDFMLLQMKIAMRGMWTEARQRNIEKVDGKLKAWAAQEE